MSLIDNMNYIIQSDMIRTSGAALITIGLGLYDEHITYDIRDINSAEDVGGAILCAHKAGSKISTFTGAAIVTGLNTYLAEGILNSTVSGIIPMGAFFLGNENTYDKLDNMIFYTKDKVADIRCKIRDLGAIIDP